MRNMDGDDILGDDISIVINCWNQSTRINLEIFGCTWDGEIDVHCFERETEFFEGDLSTVRPRAQIRGVEGDFRSW